MARSEHTEKCGKGRYLQSRIGVEISFYSIPQEPTEHISEKVGEFLQELGAKPRLEAAKIGLKVKHSSIDMHFSIFAELNCVNLCEPRYW